MKNIYDENRSRKPLLIAMMVAAVIFLYMQTREGMSFGDTGNSPKENKSMNSDKYNPLTPEEEYVILRKGTERPYTGKYTNNKTKGIYTCKQCDAPLYDSKDKFDSNCGWPSFDDELYGAVRRVPDADGRRTEIICANCDGHLGHVFLGERFTKKNTRHCVNSISMNFVPKDKTETAIFASGCFWGTEFHFKKKRGVLLTTVGYIGGHKRKPTYREVCSGTTGHAEAVEVVFNPDKVSFEELAKLYFETHDPTQVNRQGPDIGAQYRSEIFYLNDKQKEVSQKLIDILKAKGLKVATRLTKASKFWDGEEYHQDYYQKKRGTPYCHIYTKRF
jgi:peptide methionine sulfoxide reductase msrA/msrB